MPDPKYTYEVRTQAGVLIARLPFAHNGRLIEAENEPKRLTFSYPLAEAGASSITKANLIYLDPLVGGTMAFRMTGRGLKRDDNNIPQIVFSGLDLLSQLSEEPILSYLATPDDALTVSDILDDLIALQISANPITVGTVDAAIGDAVVSINIANQTILQAIKTLQSSVGGYFRVNADRTLDWTVSIGSDTGQQLRYGKNLSGITRDENYLQLCTRLYAYGVGEGGLRLNLIDAGEANEYIDSDTIGTYDTVPRIVFFKNAFYPDMLLAQAEAYLEEHKNPVYTYDVDMVDLSMLDDGFSFDALELGSTMKVIDEDLGIDVEVRIPRLDRNLDNPEDVKIDLSSKTTSIQDTIALISEGQRELAIGNVVGERLYGRFWEGLEFITFFESLDGYGVTGNVTINEREVAVYCPPGTFSLLYKRPSRIYPDFTWAKNRRFITTAVIARKEYQTIYIVIGNASSVVATNNHIGFVIENDAVKGTCADGTTQSKTATLITLAALAEEHLLEARLTAGSKVEFYIDGVYEGQLTTNLPSGTNYAEWIVDINATDTNPGSHGGYAVVAAASYWKMMQEP